MSIIFLAVDHVLAIHARQLAEMGGLAGVRDRNLLESAVAAPRATFSGSFLHRISMKWRPPISITWRKNHPFFDGNKRVAAEAAVLFLEANGRRFRADPDQFADFVLEIARGNADKAAATAFFRENCATG